MCDEESALAKLPFDSVSPAATGFGVISGLTNLSKLHSVLPNCGSFLASSLDESTDDDEPLSVETSMAAVDTGATGCVGALISATWVVGIALLALFSLSSLSSDRSRSFSSSLRSSTGYYR